MCSMKFDNEAEERFYDFLVDFELTSMIKGIKSQIKIYSGGINRRVDFVISLKNGHEIFIEVDGATHNIESVKKIDKYKDFFAEQCGVNVLRVKFYDFFNDRETVANKIQAIIEMLNAD